MRTTVDLPTAVHRRAREIAEAQHRSLSSVVSELATRGLAQLDQPVELHLDTHSGLPVLSIGRKLTSAEVAEALDE